MRLLFLAVLAEALRTYPSQFVKPTFANLQSIAAPSFGSRTAKLSAVKLHDVEDKMVENQQLQTFNAYFGLKYP